jgi:hypothetical protein
MYEENGSRDFSVYGRKQDGDVKIKSNGENRNSLECPKLSASAKLIRIGGSPLLTGMFS